MRLDVLLFLLLLPSATAPTPPRVEGRGNGGAPRSLATFLANIHLENYLDLFIREEITMELLPMITESQFERIGVRTLGQRMRIVQSAQSINTDDEIIERVVDANEAPHEEIVQEEPETHPPNEHGVVDNNLEETRRGDEHPEFYFEFSVNGDKKYHKFNIGFDKFNRHFTKENGRAYFKCDSKGCSSTLTARYPSFETWQDDILEITSGPTEHMVDGVEHPPEKGKRLKELANRKIKDNMKADPLKPIPLIQEEVVNEILESLGD